SISSTATARARRNRAWLAATRNSLPDDRRALIAAPSVQRSRTMGYRVAVVGATGNVGREVLAILAEREFPMDEVAAVASSRSQGVEVEIGDSGRMVKCQSLEHF